MEKSRERRETGLFAVEGKRELLHCLNAGFMSHTVFICPDILSEKDTEEIISGCGCPVIEVPRHLYEKIAYRGSTEGVIAELYCKMNSLEDLKLKDNPLLIVLEAVEKPGNLGAVLRSRCSHNMRSADRPVQSQPHTFQHRSFIHSADSSRNV